MAEPFARADLLSLFRDLGERLRKQGVRANVYIVGGAAISLLYDERRVTRDIDSVILEGLGPLTEAVRAIARERDLPSSWLNEQAAIYVSLRPDNGQARVFDHPNLVVAAASPKHLLAMKLVAARASSSRTFSMKSADGPLRRAPDSVHALPRPSASADRTLGRLHASGTGGQRLTSNRA